MCIRDSPEAEDLIEVISQVQQMENVDSDQLFIQGESQGGFVGAYVAAQILSLIHI